MLIVEDREEIAGVLAEILTLEGHVVVVTMESRQALSKAQSFRPEAVLLDYLMPGMNGDEVADQLRADVDVGTVPIILMTASVNRYEALKFTPDYYIEKPFDLDDLLAVVDGATGKAREEPWRVA